MPAKEKQPKSRADAGIGKGTPGPGRPPGSKNKITAAVKDALRGALESSHPDGAEGFFLELARDDPKTFSHLVAKLIPNEVQAEVKTENTITVIDLTGQS